MTKVARLLKSTLLMGALVLVGIAAVSEAPQATNCQFSGNDCHIITGDTVAHYQIVP